MSDIETEAQQTLSWIIRDGAHVSLLTRGVVTLAVFAFKCAVVANYMALNESPFFTPHTRHRFKESLTIPPGVHMWLAAFQGKHLFAGRFIAYYTKPTAGELGDGDLDFYVFTFAAGHLVFQVVAPRWLKLHKSGRRLPRLSADPIWDSAAIQFWPSDGFAVSWPPFHYLDDEALDTFTHRFGSRISVSLS